jgi:hypothetical protein
MKKLIILLLIVPFIGYTQSVDWKRYQNDSIIELNDDFEPINFDTNVSPRNYSFYKFVDATFNFGQDSISITFLGIALSQYITFRYVITTENGNLHLRVIDGKYTPPKYDPAKYEFNHFGQMDLIMLSVILGILMIVVIFNFKTIFKIKKNAK